MRVQERPHELAAHVLEPEFKMSVLIDGVVAGVISRRADGRALFFGDLVGRNQARSVAGAGCGDGGVIGMRKRIAQRDARLGLLDRRRCLNFARAVGNAGGHAGEFYRARRPNKNLLLGLGCLGRFGGLVRLGRLLVFPCEALHASGCVDELLFAREERMALRADFHSHQRRFIS